MNRNMWRKVAFHGGTMKIGNYTQECAFMARHEVQLIRGNTQANRASTLHARGVLCVIAASMVLAIATANECHGYVKSLHPFTPFAPSLLFGTVMWLWWGGIAVGMWRWAQHKPAVLRFSFRSISLHLGIASFLGMVHLTLLQEALRVIGEFWHVWGTTYGYLNYLSVRRFGTELMIYGFVFGISEVLHSQAQRQHDAMQKLALEKQLTQAQLKALQMQMEPHFLFNTLNAITSLMVQGRNKEAIKTMTHLNTILRTTLQRKSPEKVPFAEELRIVESYLAIQQVRFAGRLDVKIDATPEALDGLVPCFLLQPLVENAIQHGIAPLEAGGLIETHVKRVGDMLWMEVKDNGCGPIGSDTKGHGIGMQNIRERLAYFYPGAYEFNVVAPAGGGYEVTVQIPYERAMA
jgi:two-component sensor histidine kinase